MEEAKIVNVEKDEQGQRVDAFLSKMLPELSRSRIQNLLQRGCITREGISLKASYKIVYGDVLNVVIPIAEPTHLIPQEIELDILYEDKDLVVLNKPAGLVVHPGAGNLNGTLANALIHRFPDMQVNDSHRPGLVHRLDKETSGVMLCARNDLAFHALADQFKSRTVKKMYTAFCFGEFKQPQFELITGHARHKFDRKRFTTKLLPPEENKGGLRIAHSIFEVLQEAGGVSELSVELLTGRTHQIRAHLSDLHHPILQDSLYGGTERTKKLKDSPVRQAILGLERHALHARSIEFAHPVTEKILKFEAILPEDLRAVHDAMIMVNALGL